MGANKIIRGVPGLWVRTHRVEDSEVVVECCISERWRRQLGLPERFWTLRAPLPPGVPYLALADWLERRLLEQLEAVPGAPGAEAVRLTPQWFQLSRSVN